MLHLKIGTKEDLRSVLSLAEELHQASVYQTHTSLDRNRVSELYLKSLEIPNDRQVSILLLHENNVIGLLVVGLTEMIYSDEKIATEVAFWITPSYRNYKSIKMLMEAYHFWAKKVGCKALLIGKIKDKTKPEEYKLRIL